MSSGMTKCAVRVVQQAEWDIKLVSQRPNRLAVEAPLCDRELLTKPLMRRDRLVTSESATPIRDISPGPVTITGEPGSIDERSVTPLLNDVDTVTVEYGIESAAGAGEERWNRYYRRAATGSNQRVDTRFRRLPV